MKSASVSIQRQRTLRQRIACAGIGLHSGARVAMTLRPAPPDTGIVFVRRDAGGARIPARYDHVVDTLFCTALGLPDGPRVGTVEHLLAALAGCGVDNLVVELDGPEVPVMDGSAAPFVRLIDAAGVVEQGAPRRVIRILKPVEERVGDRSARLSPAGRFGVGFEITHDSAAIGRQAAYFQPFDGGFASDLAPARTYGFAADVEALRARGLALGGSLDNAVVVDGDRVLNEDGLRFADEFVRHKVLDALGDLYLAGARLVGRYDGVRAGHQLNNRLLGHLFADPEAWCFALDVEDDEADDRLFPATARAATA